MTAIGIDIEKVSRFQNKTLEKDKHFLKSIFTDTELEYSFSNANPAQHLCARFCAKEAAIKALYSLNLPPAPFNEIEIINKHNGIPMLKIKNHENLKTTVSLSHTTDNAVAFVLIEMA